MAKLIMYLFLTLITVSNAHANLITLESRDLDSAFDRSNLLSYWNSLTDANVELMENLEPFRVGRNKINLLTLIIPTNTAQLMDMNIAVDAGFGAEVF